MKNSIFVQIASYRDPELLPTLRDLIKNAKYPKNLKICIAWQHNLSDEWDNLDEFKNDDRFEIIDIKHDESKGCCWARYCISQKYSGEKYTLQIDSHERFVQNWDVKLIKMYNKLKKEGNKKPLITGYIPSYVPKDNPKDRSDKIWSTHFWTFTPKGGVTIVPHTHENNPKNPLPARFYAAGFAFASGKFCEEVPHDPCMYYLGEETSITVRAFTNGYDLFHANEVIAWHYYTRVDGEIKHWDDHKDWVKADKASQLRMRQILGTGGISCLPCIQHGFGIFGLGNERTLEDYEEYSGIKFQTMRVRKSALDNEIPTHGKKEEVYLPKTRLEIHLNSNDFTHDDYSFVGIFLHDVNGKELYRKDEDGKWFMGLMEKDKTFKIDVDADVDMPHKWIVWAFSKKDHWAEMKECILE